MRFLYILLFIFELSCVVNGASACNYQLPRTDECTQDIPWKAKSQENALAICNEHFPTPFLTATFDKDKITCTVKAAYECLDKNAVIIYDKCFTFIKKGGAFDSSPINDYLSDKNGFCKDGGDLFLFASHAHAKFVALSARAQGIRKLWVGQTTDGKTLASDKMMHKDLWKVVPGDYWDGEKLVKDNIATPNNDAKYLILRTNNDYVNSRSQGSFERAKDTAKATFACAYPAYFQQDQKWYCDKMAALGIDAVYDSADSRCLYLSTRRYSYEGKQDGTDLKNFNGCLERPTPYHLGHVDDGTASPVVYKQFKGKNARLRLAGVRIPHDFSEEDGFKRVDHPRGQKISDKDEYSIDLLQWKLMQSTGKRKNIFYSKLKWRSNYPFNENSSFKKDSTTLAVLDGEFVDTPSEVRLRTVCSLSFFKECEIKNNPCGLRECVNIKKYDTVYKGFYQCTCPVKHTMQGSDCVWNGPSNECALMKFLNTQTSKCNDIKMNLERWTETTGNKFEDVRGHHAYGPENDKMYEVVVRKGCKFTARSHYTSTSEKVNIKLVDKVEFGTHLVPNKQACTLDSNWGGLSASSFKCTCP